MHHTPPTREEYVTALVCHWLCHDHRIREFVAPMAPWTGMLSGTLIKELWSSLRNYPHDHATSAVAYHTARELSANDMIRVDWSEVARSIQQREHEHAVPEWEAD